MLFIEHTNTNIFHVLYNHIFNVTYGGLQGTISENVEKGSDGVNEHQIFENITSIAIEIQRNLIITNIAN